MQALPNLIFASILLLCFVVVVKQTSAPGFRFSPALLFYVIFVLQQAVGCMLLARDNDSRDALCRTALELGALGFTAGLAVVSICARFHPRRELPGVRQRLRFDEPNLGSKFAIMLLGYVVTVLIVAVYYQRGGGMPLFHGVAAMLSGDEARVAQQVLKEGRMQLTYFEGSSYRGQGYIDQLRMIVLPYVWGCFLLWSRGRSLPVRLLAAASGIPVALFLLGTGQRHPILAFLVTMTIVIYAISSPKTHKRLLTGFFFCGVFVFFVMTYMLGRYTHTDSLGSDLPMVVLGLWNRIAYSNAFGTMAVFHLFPNPEPFRYGMTWLHDLQGFLPGPYTAFSAWLFYRLYGFVGTASPMSFGEMYVNFGLPGVLLGAMVLGMLLQSIQVLWARRPQYGAEDVMVYGVIGMACGRWAMGGVLAPMQFGFFAVPLLYGCIHAGQIFVRGVISGSQSLTHRSCGVAAPGPG